MESDSDKGTELNLKHFQYKLRRAVEERGGEVEEAFNGIHGRLSLTRKILEAKH